MRIAKIGISMQIIQQGFTLNLIGAVFNALPAGATYHGSQSDTSSLMHYILVGHDSFKDIPSGSGLSSIPNITALFQRGYDGVTELKEVDYSEALDPGKPSYYTGVKASTPPPPPPPRCWYPSWKKYTGIMDSFDYCDKCGKKKGEHE